MKTILIIEDDHKISDSLADILEAHEYEVLCAGDGREGVAAARNHYPDLIICDIMMPELDGYAVFKALRDDPDTAVIPFIFLSAKAEHHDRRYGMNIGADDYLTKPIDIDELLRAIEIRLWRKQALKHTLDELRSNLSQALPHEFLTPLNAVIGFSGLILDSIENNEIIERHQLRDHARMIHDAGHRLHRMVSDFLMYAHLRSISSDAAAIRELRRPASELSEQTVAAALKELEGEYHRSGDCSVELQPYGVQVGSNYCRYVVTELLRNAMKFSDAGTSIAVSGKVQGNNYLLTLRDAGRGMSDAQIARLGAHIQFDRLLYEQQGVGIGLAIVQLIAELHGGALKVKSLPDIGTNVSVTLPLAAP